MKNHRMGSLIHFVLDWDSEESAHEAILIASSDTSNKRRHDLSGRIWLTALGTHAPKNGVYTLYQVVQLQVFHRFIKDG
jgi:hypothetical protein